MQRLLLMAVAVPATILPCLGGCGNDAGPTVIQPAEPYQLSEQESRNRERANKLLSEQRQQ